MALLPPRYLKAVVTIGTKSAPEEMKATGQSMRTLATGFLYSYPTTLRIAGETQSGVTLWIVTCKHVIEGIKELNKGEIMVRLNKSAKGEMETYRVEDWYEHPTADVAVTQVSGQAFESGQLQFMFFEVERDTLTREKAEEAGLSEGDEIFMLGFPTGWRVGGQDYPITRQGVLAQIQGWFRADHDSFLLDGSGFPGNSGGPVVTKPQILSVNGSSPVTSSLLIGMVSERKLSSVVGNGAGMVQETADLVVVTPMDAINETINEAIEVRVIRENQYQEYKNQIQALGNGANQNGFNLNETSEADFWLFLRSMPLLREAEITLGDNSNLRAVWHGEDNSNVEIQFLGNQSVEFVIFKHRQGVNNISRVTGIDTLDGFKRQIHAFELKSLFADEPR